MLLTTDSAFCGAEKLSEITLYYQDGQYFNPAKRIDPSASVKTVCIM
jgi:23S rRNA (cytosine1962-C5)-methyltransferase